MSTIRWGTTITCFLLLASSLTSAGAQTRPNKTSYSLKGQVIDGLTGRAIPDVELVLQTEKWESAGEPIAPDSLGQFIFRDLAPGQYILSAARPDFGTIFYGQLPDPGWVQTIDVGSDEEGKLIVFRVIPRSSITGTVRDEWGDQMTGANVTLSRSIWRDGSIILESLNQASTDDRGQYRINNVAPGRYVVCTAANFGGTTMAPSSSHLDFLSHIPTRYYARSCSPAVQLAPGQATTANLTISSTSVARIRGRLVNAVPNLSTNLRLKREDAHDDGAQFWQGSFDQTKGTFEFHGIPPGNYRLEADLNGKTSQGEKVALAAQLPIAVGSADLEDIELTLDRNAEIEVVLHGPQGEKLEQGDLNLGLRPTTQDSSGTRWMEAPENGVLGFALLHPGLYWVLTRSNDSSCVQSVKLGLKEVLHGNVLITAAMTAKMDVTVSKSCGHIKGRVIINEQPVADAKVLLLLSGSAKDPGDLVTNFTDDKGEFSFASLPFGHYQLWAWSVSESHSFVGPVSLADEKKHATFVAVESDQPVNVELTLLKPEVELR